MVIWLDLLDRKLLKVILVECADKRRLGRSCRAGAVGVDVRAYTEETSHA